MKDPVLDTCYRHLVSLSKTLENWWLCPNMTDKLLTGTFSHACSPDVICVLFGMVKVLL